MSFKTSKTGITSRRAAWEVLMAVAAGTYADVALERILRKSVEYAFGNRESSSEFVKIHAQEVEREVVDAHINLYVNDFSISLGEEGKGAIERIFQNLGKPTDNIFIR